MSVREIAKRRSSVVHDAHLIRRFTDSATTVWIMDGLDSETVAPISPSKADDYVELGGAIHLLDTCPSY